MKKVEIFAGVNASGGITIDAFNSVFKAISQHADKNIRITIERKRKMRSLSQNSYYWGIVIPAVQGLLTDYGNDVDAEETHSFLKEHIGKLVHAVADKAGRRLAVVKSSAKLSTAEFEAYLDRVKRWASTEGVVIPDPRNEENESLGEKICST